MPRDGPRIRPAPRGIFVQGRVIVGNGLPVEPVTPDFLRQNPDSDLGIVGRLKHLLQRPPVLSDPVGVDLHEPHVEGLSRAQGGAGHAHGLGLALRAHILPGHVDDPGMPAALLPSDGQSQNFRHAVLVAGALQQPPGNLPALVRGSRRPRLLDAARQNQ